MNQKTGNWIIVKGDDCEWKNQAISRMILRRLSRDSWKLQALDANLQNEVAILRAYESQKPAGERICYDPYAIHFVSPEILEWAACNPDKAMALQEMSDRLFPGLDNFVIARVRYFDDFVKRSIDGGLEQLIILGAGYDSRAYRIEELKKITTF